MHLWLFPDDVHHRVFESLFVLAQSVLLPGEVHDSSVEVVASHAALKEPCALTVVWLLLELELSAVLHELSELGRMASAKLFQRRLNLLLLDVVVLFIL